MYKFYSSYFTQLNNYIFIKKANSLTPEEIEACKQAFSLFDKNGDGGITGQNLYQLFFKP